MMDNFDFTMGTKIYFGAGRVDEIGEIVLQNFNAAEILVLFGNHSISSGLIDRIVDNLKKVGIVNSVHKLGGVLPRSEKIDSVLCDLRKELSIDLIIAVGGGSIIDTAKALSASISSDCKIWDLVEGKAGIRNPIPIIAVVTNPASGSESNGSAVITNDRARVKRGLSNSLLVPKCAILDPELTCSISAKETVRSATDIMFHSIERYLSSGKIQHSVSNNIAISVIKDVMQNLEIAVKDPNNIDARGNLLWCGTCSNSGLTGLGDKVEFPIHQLGHQITAFFEVPHADSLTAVWKSWAYHAMDKHYIRFAALGRNLFDIKTDNDKDVAKEAIDRLDFFWKSFGMPTSLKECCGEISDETLSALIDSITNRGKRIIGSFWKLDHNDVYTIIERAAM